MTGECFLLLLKMYLPSIFIAANKIEIFTLTCSKFMYWKIYGYRKIELLRKNFETFSKCFKNYVYPHDLQKNNYNNILINY